MKPTQLVPHVWSAKALFDAGCRKVTAYLTAHVKANVTYYNQDDLKFIENIQSPRLRKQGPSRYFLYERGLPWTNLKHNCNFKHTQYN